MKYIKLFEDFAGAPKYWEEFVQKLDQESPGEDRIKYNGQDELTYDGNMIDFHVKKGPKISYGFKLKDGYKIYDLLKSINKCHIAAFNKDIFSLDPEIKRKLSLNNKEFSMPGMDLMSLSKQGYKLFNEIITLDQMPNNQEAFKAAPGEEGDIDLADLDSIKN
jgi:hypothetical protein